MRKAGEALVALLYPPQCLLCDEPVAEAQALCATCWAEAPLIAGPVCDRCGAPIDGAAGGAPVLCEPCDRLPLSARGWRRGRAAALYDGSARALTLALKHADRTDAAQPMGRWMARAAAPLADGVDLVIPVPLHWRRRAARRYNQSAALAMALAKALDKPAALSVLRRRRATPSQDGRSPEQRQRNMAGAFAVAPGAAHRIFGRRVLLVDDVMTTGATAAACAKTLQQGGAASVDAVFFARVALAE